MNSIIKKIQKNIWDIVATASGSCIIMLTVVLPNFSAIPQWTIRLIVSMTRVWWHQAIWEVVGWVLMIIGLRRWVWQAEIEDLKFLIPAFIMFFLIIYTYNFGKIVKTELVKGAAEIKLHYIPHLKVLSSIMCSLYMIYYGGFVQKVSAKNAVLLATTPLVAFYSFVRFFALNHTVAGVANIENYVNLINANYRLNLVANWIPFKPLLNNWVITLFYLFVEVWAAAVLVTLFWRTIIRLIDKKKAKKLIPAIMITAQIASLFAAATSNGVKFINYGQKLYFFCNMLIVCAIGIVITNYVLFSWFGQASIQNNKSIGNKKTLSMLETIKQNPEFLYVALINVFFGAVMATSEQFWRLTTETIYRTNAEFQSFNSIFNMFQARASLLFAMFFANQAPRYFNWFVNAIPAPVVAFVIGVGVFGGYVILSILGMPNNYKFRIVCFLGSVLLIIFRALKFASVDPTKEWYVCNQEKDKQTTIKSLEGGISRYGKALPSIIIMQFTSHGRVWHTGLVGSFAVIISGVSIMWMYGIKQIYDSMDTKTRMSTLQQEKLPDFDNNKPKTQ